MKTRLMTMLTLATAALLAGCPPPKFEYAVTPTEGGRALVRFTKPEKVPVVAVYLTELSNARRREVELLGERLWSLTPEAMPTVWYFSDVAARELDQFVVGTAPAGFAHHSEAPAPPFKAGTYYLLRVAVPTSWREKIILGRDGGGFDVFDGYQVVSDVRRGKPVFENEVIVQPPS